MVKMSRSPLKTTTMHPATTCCNIHNNANQTTTSKNTSVNINVNVNVNVNDNDNAKSDNNVNNNVSVISTCNNKTMTSQEKKENVHVQLHVDEGNKIETENDENILQNHCNRQLKEEVHHLEEQQQEQKQEQQQKQEHHKSNIIRQNVIEKEIPKGVIKKKLSKMRHLLIPQAIQTPYLESLFQNHILPKFHPQTVVYNGGIAKVKEWKISCYLEVMEGGVPCTNPNNELKTSCEPLLDSCDDLFIAWYKQQHACNSRSSSNIRKSSSHDGRNKDLQVKRLMTFVTRYTPAPGEQALLKHIDGAGKVDGSVVVALPIDRWSGTEEENSFEGFGGGLTFWDGRDEKRRPKEIDYDTRCGDVAFIDRAVWHQANPITKGTRWAMVIFYKVI